jgi:orotate phosphoribosyltransferase
VIKNQEEILAILAQVGAVITNSHVVYTSGKHGSAYVNKDAIYPHTREISDLCATLARRISYIKEVNDIPFIPEAVVAPAVGGVTLTQRVAEHFSGYGEGKWLDIPALYAERKERNINAAVLASLGRLLADGEELVVKEAGFVLKRDQAKYVRDKRVLVVEDVINTGGSVVKTIEAVRIAGGNVFAVGALCNRGGVTAKQLGVPHLVSLLDVMMDAWSEAECPLCAKRVPINTSVGHGAQFLARIGKGS